MPDGTRSHVDHCLNCGAPTPEEYCPKCGQEAVGAGVTFAHQMHHFVEEVFTIESRLPTSLKLLFFRPGELTRAYNEGKRVRYMTPLKLYLLASFAFFLAIAHLPGGGSAQVVKEMKDGKPSFGLHFGDLSPNESVVTAEDFEAWLKSPKAASNELPAFMIPHVRAMLRSPDGFVGAVIDMASKASMLLVPVHALLLKLLYFRKKHLYGEHLVFSFHLHAFVYLFAAMTSLWARVPSSRFDGIVNLVLVLVPAVYVVRAAQTAYAERLLLSAVKMTTVGVAYFFALIGVTILVFAGAFFVS